MRMWISYKVLQKKQLVQEREAKKIEKQLTKHARVAEKQKLREEKEKRAYEREAKMARNSLQVIAAKEEVKRLFKAK